MNSSALESRDLGLEITTLDIAGRSSARGVTQGWDRENKLFSS